MLKSNHTQREKMMLKTLLFLTLLLPLSANGGYPCYQECPVSMAKLRYFPESCGPGAYLDPSVTKQIARETVASILEVGSRDARDAIALSEYYKCHVYAFECNPECLAICKHNSSLTKNITIVEKAAWDQSGEIPFYPIFAENGKIRDPGSSSCFQLTDKNLLRYSQGEIMVPAIRLDEWMEGQHIDHFDLICMDTQGATLKILQGMGDKLKKTRYIVAECEVDFNYKEECLLPELQAFLGGLGFTQVPTDLPWDYLFVNKNLD
jgi:FkbM family methyltransferase